MFKVTFFGRVFKALLFFILIMLLSSSCDKENPVKENEPEKNFSQLIRFDISSRFLEGKGISCIESGADSSIWITSGKELYLLKGGEKETYTLDFPILDISMAKDETLWIGTNGGGLGHLTGNGITWFTKANAGLPRDYIGNVEAGPDGRIWFSSCASDYGGLVIYNGKKFVLYTPENSPLNQHVISEIEIDKGGSVYFVTSGKVSRTNVYRISDFSWDCLGNENGTFYWVSVFSVAPSGVIYLIEDFSLSSSSIDSNALFEYRGKTWQKVEADFISLFSLFSSIKADKRNYCWLAGFGENSPVLHVYNGESWVSSPEGIFPDDYVTVIEADSENNIWIGTSQNGVFVLNQ